MYHLTISNLRYILVKTHRYWINVIRCFIFHLDIFLPRIVDVALHSSDRQSKITACELLQSIMLYMIGKSANNRSNAAVCFPSLLIINNKHSSVI